VTTALCDGSGNGTDAGAATDAMSDTLDAQVENLASSPEDVAANKNKLATVVQSVAASINDVTSGADTKAMALRTKMVTTLKDAVLATSGPALDIGAASSALASISANPEQLSFEAQGMIVMVIDGILAQDSVVANGIHSEVAQNLVGAVGDTRKASSSRRALVVNEMTAQLKSITNAALMQTETGADARTFTATGLAMAVRKMPAKDITSSSIGMATMDDPWGFEVLSEFGKSGAENAVVIVQALRSSSEYVTSSQQAVSDVLSLAIWDVNSGMLVPHAEGAIRASFILSKTANSPICTSWDGAGWQRNNAAMLTSSRIAGANVVCNMTEAGSFVILDVCSPSTTCSGNGQCRVDGTCYCDLGWTGSTCDSQYCDDSLFTCANGGECECMAEPFNCVEDCVAKAGCETECIEKCGRGQLNAYDLASCPTDDAGVPRAMCTCPCGYSGPRCETTEQTAAC